VRKLAVVAAIVLPLLLLVDQMARSWAETKLRERAAAYYPPAASTSATIHSFPFLGRLVVQGLVPEVTLTMDDVRFGTLLVNSLRLDLHTVDIDKGELARGRVRVLDIGQGRIDLRVDGGSLARAVDADVRFLDGSIEVHKRVGGKDVVARGQVTLDGNTLRLRPTSVEGSGLPASAFALSYQLPGSKLPPCRADVRAVPGGLVAGCTFTDVPESLVRNAPLDVERPG
jgi:hypothetical protein